MIWLIRYGEIGLKGKNRPFFEKKLIESILANLRSRGVHGKIHKISGRLVLEAKKENVVHDALSHTFGITSFSPAEKVKPKFEDILNQTLTLLKNKKPSSFKLQIKRLDKTFSLTSLELAKKLGKSIEQKSKIPVSFKSPDLVIFIEIAKQGAFVFTEKFAGPGGLPVGSAGKVVVLLSGGIDSAVAGWLVGHRGCSVHFLHFYPGLKPADKVHQLHAQYQKYDPRSQLTCLSAKKITRELLKKIPARYRIILLRRIFNRIASQFAKKIGAKAIVTGDNLAQVASQTLENLHVIDFGTDFLILRPVLCYDKQEIIELAKKIGTYEISIKPSLECCSLLISRHPETRARLSTILKLEQTIQNFENF